MAGFIMKYGGKKGRAIRLKESPEHVVVRIKDRNMTLGDMKLPRDADQALQCFEPIIDFSEAGVRVLRCTRRTHRREARDEVRGILKRTSGIEFAGRVLCQGSIHSPVVYTENAFVQFDPQLDESACRGLIGEYGFQLKRPLDYASAAYFIGAPAGTGWHVFEMASKLLERPEVVLCHPEVVSESRPRAAFEQQWHLHATMVDGRQVDQHASVISAWQHTRGEGTTIAVIDDGVDVDHPEFRDAGKVIAPRDVSLKIDNARPKLPRDNHGTACAGVACAAGSHGAAGVAPDARLMPLRLVSGLGSQAEADAFVWAADHGADVISCSWGPPDGDFRNPNDPLHRRSFPLPDSTRLAIDYAIDKGRNGKGCVITWAAGNGNESADLDGYANYDKVIAVAACDDRGKKAPYSDFGQAVWCAFPSNHFFASVTRGIWTTDRVGAHGYNSGHPSKGDDQGLYTNSFGGTSSACPGAAGVAALILSKNPDLAWHEVKELMKRCCDPIDQADGQYDAQGHSPFFGYGRLNAQKALELITGEPEGYRVLHKATHPQAVKDMQTTALTVAVGDRQPIQSIRAQVNITHSYIGDLTVTLKPPPGLGSDPIRLHDRSGDNGQNLNMVYSADNVAPLANLHGKIPTGDWVLEVHDHAARDEGILDSFAIELTL